MLRDRVARVGAPMFAHDRPEALRPDAPDGWQLRVACFTPSLLLQQESSRRKSQVKTYHHLHRDKYIYKINEIESSVGGGTYLEKENRVKWTVKIFKRAHVGALEALPGK